MSLRVDVATGETTLYEVDLRLPGFIPLVLARTYRSGDETAGLFGAAWHASIDITLEVAWDRLVFRGATGERVTFTPVQVGVQATHNETGLVLQHHPDAYVVFFSPRLQQVFPKRNASGGVLRIGRIEDRSGNALQFGYDGGRLVQIVDTLGRQVRLSYAGERVSAVHVVGPEGSVPVRAFRYDGYGDLVAVQDATGREARYQYQQHLMVAYTARSGATYLAQYDEQRRCIARWCGDGSAVRRFAYDPARGVTLVQATDGLQTVYQHTGGRVLQRTGPSGLAQQYHYDERQRLIGFTDETGDPVTFQRVDPDKRAMGLSAGSRMASFQFDAQGLAQTATDGLFGPFSLAYDEHGHLTRVTTPSGAVWSFERDRRGAVQQVVSPEGRRLRFVWAANGRELEVSDELGLRYTERYDLLGRLTERIDALGRRERRRYDPEGRLVTVTIEGGYQAQFAYDADGRLAAVESDGRRAVYRYDAFGRLLAQTEADGREGRYQYDREGRLTSAETSRGSVRFDYEEGRRILRAGGVDGTGAGPVTDPVFGLSGEPISAVLAGTPVTFAYDADGRLAAIEHGERRLAFTYDGDGLPVTVEDAAGRVATLRYDRRGRLIEVAAGGQSGFRLDYDPGDRLQVLRAHDGTQIQFQYDVLDRLHDARLMGADGSPRPPRRLALGEVVSDRLPLGPLQEVILAQGRYGLVLAWPLGTLQVPVWVQDDRLNRGVAGVKARMIDGCLRGSAAALQEREHCSGHDLLRRWSEADACRWCHTEIPEEVALTRSGTAFFLRRTFHDEHVPARDPLYVPHHPAAAHIDWPRSPDDVATGSHWRAPLKPSPWASGGPAAFVQAAAGDGVPAEVRSILPYVVR